MPKLRRGAQIGGGPKRESTKMLSNWVGSQERRRKASNWGGVQENGRRGGRKLYKEEKKN